MPGTHIEVDEYFGLVVMTELEPLVHSKTTVVVESPGRCSAPTVVVESPSRCS